MSTKEIGAIIGSISTLSGLVYVFVSFLRFYPITTIPQAMNATSQLTQVAVDVVTPWWLAPLEVGGAVALITLLAVGIMYAIFGRGSLDW
jgi:hypothetical protein